MSDRPVFLYAAIYDEIADAEADYEAVFDLHAMGAIGTFDSAVIRRDEDGKVHVTKTEKPTQHGAWTGAGVGALVGIIFPPALIGSAIVGAGAGGLIGHLRGGISRGDLKELGDELEARRRRGHRDRRVEDRGAAREGDDARQQADREAGRRRCRGAQARDRRRGQGGRQVVPDAGSRTPSPPAGFAAAAANLRPMAAATKGRSEGSGWLNFAATMFAVIGCFNLIDGIAAAAKDDLFADEALVVGSLVMWGFLMIVIGALQLYTSYALFKRTDLGNVLGVYRRPGSASSISSSCSRPSRSGAW